MTRQMHHISNNVTAQKLVNTVYAVTKFVTVLYLNIVFNHTLKCKLLYSVKTR